MSVWICTSCQARYSTDYTSKWGTTKKSDGLGPTPRCSKLVVSPTAPKAEIHEGNRPTGRLLAVQDPLQLCGGQLAFSATGSTIDDVKDADPIPIITGELPK